METKKEYIKPSLTTVTVKAEKGYAASINNLALWLLSINGPAENSMESYESANGWTAGTDTFWD